MLRKHTNCYQIDTKSWKRGLWRYQKRDGCRRDCSARRSSWPLGNSLLNIYLAKLHLKAGDMLLARK